MDYYELVDDDNDDDDVVRWSVLCDRGLIC